MSDKLYDFLVRTVPKLLPAVALGAFLVFEQIWICILATAICFGYIYLIQVFVEQSQELLSGYLYVTIVTLVLAAVEYNFRILEGFLS